jgi:hypothetical protein
MATENNVIPLRPFSRDGVPAAVAAAQPQRSEGAENPVDRGQTLDATLRGWLAVEEALSPWSDSTLIACLVGADPIARGALILVLEARMTAQSGRGPRSGRGGEAGAERGERE